MADLPLESQILSTPSELTWGMRGPPAEAGPLPAFFFFFTHIAETLDQAPIREVADQFTNLPLRIFTVNLPHHGPGLDSRKGVDRWKKDLAQGKDCLTPFLKAVLKDMEFLMEQGWVQPEAYAVGGLSRGGFIAFHLAALDPQIACVLAFAPLTDLFYLEEFQHLQDNALAKPLQLSEQIDSLAGRPVNIYVGNRDERVGTERVFTFAKELVERSHLKRLRSPPVEFSFFPSIGFKGHGTPPEIFRAGTRWVAKQLNLENKG